MPPRDVGPKMEESCGGHKTNDSATGCVGTMTWKIDSAHYVNVMYSVPYSHDYHSNWLAVGITTGKMIIIAQLWACALF